MLRSVTNRRTRRPSLVKRAAAAIIAMLTLAGVLSLVPTTDASAGTWAGGSVCFRQSIGGPYTGRVTSQYFTNAGWANYSTFALSSSGCESVAYPVGYYWRFVASEPNFYGSTGYAYVSTPYLSYRLTGIATKWR